MRRARASSQECSPVSSFRSALLARRAEIRGWLAAPPEEEPLIGQLCDEDQAPALHDVFVVEEINSRSRQELLLIQRALERIENKTYGICLDCGEPVPPARLRAIPWTEFCVTCQEEWDRSRSAIDAFPDEAA